MKAFIPSLDTKLAIYGIAQEFFGEMRALVENGTRPSKPLRRRLKHARNYKDCLDSLLTELSRPVLEKHFPSPVVSFESIEVPV